MKKIILCSAVALTLLGGCATNEPQQVPQAQPEPVLLDVSPAQNVHVTFADENIARGVAVMTARIGQVGTLPQLTLVVKNVTQLKFPIEYQIEWTDENGTPLMTSAAWQRITLTGNMKKSLSNIGKSQDARIANVAIRFPVDIEIYVPEPDPMAQMKLQQEIEQMQLQQMRAQQQ